MLTSVMVAIDFIHSSGYICYQKKITTIYNVCILCAIITESMVKTYILHTELAYGVIHQDCEVIDRYPHISVSPTTLVWPVLVTFVLQRDDIH